MFRMPDYVAENTYNANANATGQFRHPMRHSIGRDIAVENLYRHARMREQQDKAFKRELAILDARQSANEIVGEALVDAGPSGDGLTEKTVRGLAKVRQSALAGVPDVELETANLRLLADHDRLITETASREVDARKDWTRRTLARVHEQLLSEIETVPHRRNDIIKESARIVQSSRLPEREKRQLIEDLEKTSEEEAAHRRRVQTAAATSVPNIPEGFDESDVQAIRDFSGAQEEKALLDLLKRPARLSVRPSPGPRALRHLRENPETLADFIDYFGVDQLPQSLEHAPYSSGQDVLRTLLAVSDRGESENPYPEIDRNQPRLYAPRPGSHIGRGRSAMNAGVQSAAHVIANIPESFALADENYRVNHLLPYLRVLARVGRARQKFPDEIHVSDRIRARSSSPEELGAWIDELEKISVQDHGAYKLGQALSEGAEKHFPVNPLYDEELQQKLGHLLGTLGGYVFVGATTRGLGMGRAAGAFVAGSANQGVVQFQDALNKGASIEQAYEAAKYGRLAGLSEALPIIQFFDRFDRASGGRAKHLFAEALKGGSENAVQEAFQTLVTNMVASKLVGYDPDRELLYDLGDAAGRSFQVGMVASTFAALLGRKSKNRRTYQEGKGFSPALEKTAKPDFFERIGARLELKEFKRNADRLFSSASVEDYLGSSWHKIPPEGQEYFKNRLSNFVGKAGENIVTDLGDTSVILSDAKREYALPAELPRKQRRYDAMFTESVSGKRFWKRNASDRPQGKPYGVEVKVASSPKRKDQMVADRHLIDTNAIGGVEYLRLPANRIRPADLADVLFNHVEGRLGKGQIGGVSDKNIVRTIEVIQAQALKEERLLTAGHLALITLGIVLPEVLSGSEHDQ